MYEINLDCKSFPFTAFGNNPILSDLINCLLSIHRYADLLGRIIMTMQDHKGQYIILDHKSSMT